MSLTCWVVLYKYNPYFKNMNSLSVKVETHKLKEIIYINLGNYKTSTYGMVIKSYCKWEHISTSKMGGPLFQEDEVY